MTECNLYFSLLGLALTPMGLQETKSGSTSEYSIALPVSSDLKVRNFVSARKPY